MFIEKEMGNPDIKRLRCTMIFEADWQLLLKWHLSYGFLPVTEKAGTLAVAQGGSRKGQSAIDQATQQVLETELVHLKQTSTIDLYLDLRACFDMMVEACHNLACWRHGADVAYLRLHARMHQLMQYYVWHKFGVSSDYNTFENHPWHGAGQGAADAALWYIILSDTLIDAYHTKIAPTMMTDPTALIAVIRSLKAFIDNVILHASNPTDGPLQDLMQMAQTQLRWWDQLVQVTGGALNPKKCCGMMYHWEPDNQGILKLCTPDDPLPPITLIHRDTEQEVGFLPASARTRYLGLYLTMDHNTQATSAWAITWRRNYFLHKNCPTYYVSFLCSNVRLSR